MIMVKRLADVVPAFKTYFLKTSARAQSIARALPSKISEVNSLGNFKCL